MHGYWHATDDGYTVAGYLEANVVPTSPQQRQPIFKFEHAGGTKTTNTQALGLVLWADAGKAVQRAEMGSGLGSHEAHPPAAPTLVHANTNQLTPYRRMGPRGSAERSGHPRRRGDRRHGPDRPASCLYMGELHSHDLDIVGLAGREFSRAPSRRTVRQHPANTLQGPRFTV